SPFSTTRDTEFATLLTFSPANAVSRHEIKSLRMAAELIQATDKAPFESSMRSAYHTLIAYDRGSRSDGSTSVEGLPPCSTREIAHKMVFVPAGVQYRDSYTPRTQMSAIYFHFSPDLLPRSAGPSNTALSPRLFFEDASLWSSVQKLKDMLENAAFDD